MILDVHVSHVCGSHRQNVNIEKAFSLQNIFMQCAEIFTKIENFQLKISYFCVYICNIDCGYILMSTHNLCFGTKIRKKKHTPVNLNFTI